MMGSETVEPSSEAENADEAPSKDSVAPPVEAPAIASVAVEKPEVSPESSSSSSTEQPAAPERKASTEDPSAIIESLRARLLAERNSSKAAKQQAQQLARKVRELERGLQAEIEQRRRCEELIRELMLKLEEAGVKVDAGVENSEDPEQSSSRQLKPKWTIGSRRQSSSDGSSVEGDTLNSNAGDQQSPSSSPVSDTSVVPRRVGVSCRTLRRKESWNEPGEVDEQVKGSWSRVGADIVEISKLRDADSGWVSRAVEVLESKDEGSWSGDQELNDKSDQPSEQNGSTIVTETTMNNSQDSSAPNAAESDGSGDAQPSGRTQVQDDTHGVIAERGGEPSSPTTSAAATQTSKPSPQDPSASLPEVKPDSSVVLQPESSIQVQETRPAGSNDSVRDILRALRLAKQQLRGSSSVMNSNAGGSPGYRNSTMWQTGKNSNFPPGYSGLVVTRPLAQFVPANPAAGANELFQVQTRSSHHSYVDNNYFASPSRF